MTAVGITSFKPMPYGYRRWNGSVWPNAWVDRYNAQLGRIESLKGYASEQAEVDQLYRMAAQFDAMA